MCAMTHLVSVHRRLASLKALLNVCNDSSCFSAQRVGVIEGLVECVQ